MIPGRLQALAHAAWVAILSLPLAACPEQPPPLPQHPRQQVACALDGAETFAPACTLEDMGGTWLLGRPDGGFVKVRRVPGGAKTADGFPRVAASRVDGALELAVGPDRYRLPW